MKRVEDPRLVTGKGSFADDVKLPGMLYASFVRSPHAHARIRSIDVSAASSLPGVVAVLTGDDLVGKIGGIPAAVTEEWEMDQLDVPELPVLAAGRVYYVGQTLAVVVAQERYLARDAVDLIKVAYEPMPVVLDPIEGMSAESVKIHESLGTNGAMRKFNDRQGTGLDEAFDGADRVVRGEFTVQRLAALPLETRCCVAHYRPQEDFLTVWAATQSAHRFRRMLAWQLKRPEESVRVLALDVGGGYGEKSGIFPRTLRWRICRFLWASP